MSDFHKSPEFIRCLVEVVIFAVLGVVIFFMDQSGYADLVHDKSSTWRLAFPLVALMAVLTGILMIRVCFVSIWIVLIGTVSFTIGLVWSIISRTIGFVAGRGFAR